MRLFRSDKAAFQADIRKFEYRRPLFDNQKHLNRGVFC